jgi:uncharacterized phage-associated protein
MMDEEDFAMQIQFDPPYDSLAVANRFLFCAYRDRKIDLLKLQKLLYCAHGWYLVFTGGKRLLNEQPQAWKYGPIIPSVYHEFKHFGTDPITTPACRLVQGPFGVNVMTPYELTAGSYEESFFESIWNTYKDYNSLQLSTITHRPGGAWDQIRQQNPDREGVPIPDVMIWREFKETLDAARERSAA